MTDTPKPENKPDGELMAKARANWIKAGHDPAKFDAAMSGKSAISHDPTMRVKSA